MVELVTVDEDAKEAEGARSGRGRDGPARRSGSTARSTRRSGSRVYLRCRHEGLGEDRDAGTRRRSIRFGELFRGGQRLVSEHAADHRAHRAETYPSAIRPESARTRQRTSSRVVAMRSRFGGDERPAATVLLHRDVEVEAEGLRVPFTRGDVVERELEAGELRGGDRRPRSSRGRNPVGRGHAVVPGGDGRAVDVLRAPLHAIRHVHLSRAPFGPSTRGRARAS